MISRFVSAAVSGNDPVVYGDGLQSRDFIHVDNVVDVNLLAATAPQAPGLAMNVGMGNGVTLNELLDATGRCLGRTLHPRHEAERANDVRHSVADISLLRATLGYEPAVSFADGLKEAIAALAAESGV